MPRTSLPVTSALFGTGAGLVRLPGVLRVCVRDRGCVPALCCARCLAELLSSHLYCSVPSINLSGCKYESGKSGAGGSVQPSSPHSQAPQVPARPGAVLAPSSHCFIYCCQWLAQGPCVSGEFVTL